MTEKVAENASENQEAYKENSNKKIKIPYEIAFVPCVPLRFRSVLQAKTKHESGIATLKTQSLLVVTEIPALLRVKRYRSGVGEIEFRAEKFGAKSNKTRKLSSSYFLFVSFCSLPLRPTILFDAQIK